MQGYIAFIVVVVALALLLLVLYPAGEEKKKPKPKLIHSVQTETNAIFVVLNHEKFGQKINIFFKLKKYI